MDYRRKSPRILYAGFALVLAFSFACAAPAKKEPYKVPEEVARDLKKLAEAADQAKKPADKEWHLGRSGWFGDYRDPSTFLEMFVTGDGNNDCGYSNARFDALMKEAASIADQSRRMELFSEAEHLAILDEAAIVPLYHYVEHYMIRPHVRGAWPNQMGFTLLKQISVER